MILTPGRPGVCLIDSLRVCQDIAVGLTSLHLYKVAVVVVVVAVMVMVAAVTLMVVDQSYC